jgi:O-acetyl-ADP-ribose deacetylase (regulator of RNase III)
MAKMVVVQGDITQQEVDAIVNAANQQLKRGGGVDGAIHRAAGPELQAECDTIGGCPTGEARITKGYRLPARHVIHCVGPRYRGGDKGEADQLAGCYRHALALAFENGVKTLAFPSISTGIYGYPLEDATRIAVQTVGEALAGEAGTIEEVRFVTFGPEATEVTSRVLAEFEKRSSQRAG